MARQTVHASCVAFNGAGILIYGPSGSGKSLMALALIQEGFTLVADDQVVLEGAIARAPETIRNKIEVRGVGILAMDSVDTVPVILVVVLGQRGERLPVPERDPVTGCVLLRLMGTDMGDIVRVKAAFGACLGRYEWVVGAGRA
nr:HPr kinase/phosphatase C-terminal domain-containing protein [uncultured Neokomagataea sp.]